MATLKRINNVKIHVVPTCKPTDPTKIRGYDLCPEPYANFFLVARKNSGKTNLIYNMIKSFASKKTHVVVMAGTHNNDSTWLYIKRFLDDMGIQNTFHDGLYGEGKNPVNRVTELIQYMRESTGDSGTSSEHQSAVDRILGVAKPRERKEKKIAPRFLVILDDLSSKELRSKPVETLLKSNRHVFSKVVLSSQYIDLSPGSRDNIDMFVIFKGLNAEKVGVLYENMHLEISFERFLELYKVATEKKYDFMLVDVNNQAFRRNFDHLLT